MKQLEEEELINGLNYWGKKVLGRSEFGEECLWSDTMQGVMYNFDRGYNEELAKNWFHGDKNEKYLDFMNRHSSKVTYLYTRDEYGLIMDVWTIPELKHIAFQAHESQVAYLNKLKDDVDKCENFRQVINYLKKLDKYDIPHEFPARDFTLRDSDFEKFLKDSIMRSCEKFGESVDVSKDKYNNPYPYAEYLGLW